MPSEPIVFVVDDDAGMRQSLRFLLGSEGLTVETFALAREFLDFYSPQMRGCLVLDLRMPGMTGMELHEHLLANGIRLPVIMITGHAEVPSAVKALKAGVMDFIEKPFSDQVLVDCVRAAIARDARIREELVPCLEFAKRLAELTDRERQIIDLIVAGNVNKSIAGQLHLSAKTIEYHRARIMAKLELDSVAELVRLITRLKTLSPNE